jgi:hypothetical protein
MATIPVIIYKCKGSLKGKWRRRNSTDLQTISLYSRTVPKWAHPHHSCKVCLLFSKERNPGIAMQSIAAYDKARRVFGTIRERNVHGILALLEFHGLVTPLDLDAMLLGRIDQKLLKLWAPDSNNGEAKSLSHRSWRNIVINEDILHSTQAGTVNHPIWRMARYLFQELWDER